MKLTDLLASKFLKKEDITDEPTLTITGVDKRNVAPPDAPEEQKGVLLFAETEKPLILNQANTLFLAECLGNDPEKWPGQQIVPYVDPNITFGGKRVGGIRLRAVKRVLKKAAAPAHRANATPDEQPGSLSAAEMPDDIPF